jgi:hypothetical protein
MKTFYEWCIFIEEEGSKPSHVRTLRDTLNVSPQSLIGVEVPFSGKLGDKLYNMVGLVVTGFDDDTNPTRVKLKIVNKSPNMDSLVRFDKSADKSGDKSAVAPDEGEIDVSLEEFDQIFGKGWEPAMQMGGGAGVGPPMGMM